MIQTNFDHTLARKRLEQHFEENPLRLDAEEPEHKSACSKCKRDIVCGSGIVCKSSICGLKDADKKR